MATIDVTKLYGMIRITELAVSKKEATVEQSNVLAACIPRIFSDGRHSSFAGGFLFLFLMQPNSHAATSIISSITVRGLPSCSRNFIKGGQVPGEAVPLCPSPLHSTQKLD